MTEVATMPDPAKAVEALAKHGVVTETGTPVEIPEVKIDKPAGANPTAEPVKAEAPADTAVLKPEVPKPAPLPQDSPKPVPQPAAAASAPAPEVTWKDLLKKHNPGTNEVLKELGLDDKMIGFLDKWKSGGNVNAYLEAANADYTKMPDEEVMRRHLMQEYPGMKREDFEELYNMKVTELYKLDKDLFTEQEVRRGNILLQADAQKIREKLIEGQKALMLPDPPPPAPEPDPAALERTKQQEELRKTLEDYTKTVNDHSLTKELLASKILTVGEGADAFKFEIAEPQEMVDLLTDPEKYAAKLYDEDGKPDLQKQLLLAALVNDHKLFLKELGKHYRKLGARDAISPMENASAPGAITAKDGKPLDPIAALAQHGIIMSAGTI